jgi:hypothetical protein
MNLILKLFGRAKISTLTLDASFHIRFELAASSDLALSCLHLQGPF